MTRVFLSHSSVNKDFVRLVATELGDTAIIDERDFAAGARTPEEIVEKIDDSKIFVAFLSEKAIGSLWVQKELEIAIGKARELELDVLCFSIDKTVKYTDKRIPEILRNNYNIQFVRTPELAISRIRDEIRRRKLKESPVQQRLLELFIGRGELLQRFDTDFSNFEGVLPTYIVASNYYDGMGRTHFIRHGLDKIGILKKSQWPVTVVLRKGESVENFIIQLNSYVYNDEATRADLRELTMERKLKLALNLVLDYKRNNRLIFIRDEGAIVLPNREIADWFKELTQADDLHNRTTFCVIATWQPANKFLGGSNPGVHYHVRELNRTDSRNLFGNLLNIYGVRNNISQVQKETVASQFTGIPAQIIFTVQQIRNSGIEHALNDLEEIQKHSDSYSATLLERIKSNPIAYQMCLVLADLQLSLQILYDIFGESDEVRNALALLDSYSVIEYTKANITSVMLISTLADYIKRRGLTASEEIHNRREMAIKNYVKSSFDDLASDDYSKLMLVIGDNLKSGRPIPEKYYIAPLLINNIIREYNAGNYESVERYCKSLLQQNNLDSQVRWELHYHLVRVYARTGNEEFWNALKDSPLDYIDKEFLQGFFFRNKGNDDDRRYALEFFERVLQEAPRHSRARREIVNTYILLEEYNDALDYAKENYLTDPNDILHLQSYFIALIRRKNFDSVADYSIVSDLLSKARSHRDMRAPDIARCMEGEFKYYVESDFSAAQRLLKDAVKLNGNERYPLKALFNIYRREGMFEDAKEIKKRLATL